MDHGHDLASQPPQYVSVEGCGLSPSSGRTLGRYLDRDFVKVASASVARRVERNAVRFTEALFDFVIQSATGLPCDDAARFIIGLHDGIGDAEWIRFGIVEILVPHSNGITTRESFGTPQGGHHGVGHSAR